jgi:glyoxalase family protein
VPVGSLSFWKAHLDRHKVKRDEISGRFGQKTLAFYHPTGFGLELIEDDKDTTEGWTTPDISADVAIRGFYSVVMSVRETGEQDRFFTQGLGFTRAGVEGAYTRYHINEGGAQKTVELLHQPDVPQGSWIFAQGMVHHVAFAVPTDKEQKVAKDYLEGIGYTDVSDVKDRNYFHSVYCRSPGGILCEIATSDIGFAIDEPMDKLGRKMLLPPWFEDRRAEIVAPLEPIKVPEYLTA